jgi:hypothetical protein
MFEEFLQLLGDKVRLRGFDKYKGGLGKRFDIILIIWIIRRRRHLFLSQILFTT